MEDLAEDGRLRCDSQGKRGAHLNTARLAGRYDSELTALERAFYVRTALRARRRRPGARALLGGVQRILRF